MVEFVCFHNPDEENGYLSNWTLCQFNVDGVEYSSLEQYMMAEKARCFYDKLTLAKIMSTNNVALIKKLGRQVTNYDNQIWDGLRQLIVYEGLLAKFSQNADFKAKLLVTKQAVLVECAVNDRIWANGLSLQDPNRNDPSKWLGRNLMGYTLMQVRKKLES